MESVEAVAVRLVAGTQQHRGERVVTVMRPCVDCAHTRDFFRRQFVRRLVGEGVAEVVSSVIGCIPVLFLGHEKVRLFLRQRERADAFVARLRCELLGVDVTYYAEKLAVDLFDRNFRPAREETVAVYEKDAVTGEPVGHSVCRAVAEPATPLFFACAPLEPLPGCAGLGEREKRDQSIPCASYEVVYAVCEACPLGETRQLASWGFERPSVRWRAAPETSAALVVEERLSLDLRRLANPASRRATVEKFLEQLGGTDMGDLVRLWTLRHLAHLDSDEFIKYFQGCFSRLFPLLREADATPEMALLSAALMAVTLSVSSRDCVYANDGAYLRRILDAVKPDDILLTPLNLKCYAAILVFADRVLSVEVRANQLLSQRTLYRAFDALYAFALQANSLTQVAVALLARIAHYPAFFLPGLSAAGLSAAGLSAAGLSAAGLSAAEDAIALNAQTGERNKAAARAVVKAFRVAIRSGNSGPDCFPAVSMILAGSEQSPVLGRVLASRRFPWILRWLVFATGVSMEQLTVAASPNTRVRLTLVAADGVAADGVAAHGVAADEETAEQILRHL